MLLGLVDHVSAAEPARAGRLGGELAGLDIPTQPERWISRDAYLEGLARVDHVDDLGAVMLRAGMEQDFADMGLFGKAVTHAESLWAALCIIRDAVPYMVPGASFDIRIRRGRCRFAYSHPFGVGIEATLDVQYTIGLICNLLAERTGLRNANVVVGYPGARTDSAALLGDVSTVAVSEACFAEFDDHLLRTPLKRSIPALSDVILTAMDEVPDRPDPAREMSDLVTLLQSASLRNQQRALSQRELGHLLDLPLRTLQHTLAREGSRFDELRDAPRHAAARAALRDGREIAEVAESIGFSHRQNFSAAFTRWEGCSPSEFQSRG